MTDYTKAFKEGLTAAKDADIARREINEVFKELDQQIRKGSDGKIAVDRRQYEVRESGWQSMFTIQPKVKETYWAITAHNPSFPDSPVKQLARWTPGRAGYPCKIVWGDTEMSCYDRQSLESSLAEVLRDPLVGEKIYELMNLKPQNEEEDSIDKPKDN